MGEVEDRFEPTEFVDGTLVEFDEVSEQGGTIREGSLVYTPPEGFTGEDRYTFFVRGADDLVREAEVLVEVRVADLDDVQDAEGTTASPSPPGSPAPSPTLTQDAAERALADASLTTTDVGDRWDPPWLAWMSGIAAVLVSLALLWWLFIEVRLQDRLRRR